VSRSGQASRFHESQARPMGRGTGGVKGMNVSKRDNAVLAMDVARDDQELLVVTENGYGKRTAISDYPVKNRGTMGVKTIAVTDKKGALAGALVVREHQELVFISENGMVQRTGVRGINRYGRGSQGVKVMNVKDDDRVSAIALIAESEAESDASVAEGLPVEPYDGPGDVEDVEDVEDDDDGAAANGDPTPDEE
jgi:DNA gyrase subunit A